MLAKRVWLLLLLCTAITYFYGLGRAPLVGSDEPRYVEVAREMFLRGDWVTPTLSGRPWFEKPALVYWGEIASFKAFGVTEWSARLGVACAGLLTLIIAGWLSRRVEEKGGAEWHRFCLSSSAALASSAGLVVFSRGVNFDVFVTATLTLTLACFIAAESEASERVRHWLLAGFYAGMGASLLAKGLIGVVLPCGIVVLYFLLRRRWPDVRRLAPWYFALTILIAASWYAPVIARHGWTFIDEFIIKHHFARYVSNKYHHPGPFYYYIPVMAILALPWTPFLVTALAGVRRWNWRGDDSSDRLRIFVLAWFVLPLIFFSFSGSKLPGYILPALPAAALLAGERLASYVRGEDGTWAMRATGALTISLSVLGIVYALQTNAISLTRSLIMTAPLICAGLLSMVLTNRRRLVTILTASSIFAVMLIFLSGTAEMATRSESVRELMQTAAQHGYASAPVYGLHTIERTAEFYAAGQLVYDEDDSDPVNLEGVDQVAEIVEQRGDAILVIVPVQYISQLTEYRPIESEVLGTNGKVAIVAVRERKTS